LTIPLHLVLLLVLVLVLLLTLTVTLTVKLKGKVKIKNKFIIHYLVILIGSTPLSLAAQLLNEQSEPISISPCLNY